jgi:hypothetical protein
MPSPPPYGYGYQPATRNHGGYWLVEPKEAEVVSQVFRWYIEDSIRIFDIVDRLNARKIPSAEGGQWGHKRVGRPPRKNWRRMPGLPNAIVGDFICLEAYWLVELVDGFFKPNLLRFNIQQRSIFPRINL